MKVEKRVEVRLNILDVMVKELFEDFVNTLDTIEDFMCYMEYKDCYKRYLKLNDDEEDFLIMNWEYVRFKVERLGRGWEEGDVDNVDDYLLG